jgi:Holin of 3TMs, for gene-transfer release
VADNDTGEPDTLANEGWFNSRWRPAMAWLYAVICAFDFLVFPMFNAILQPEATAATFHEWHPLTLQGGGLFHVAMGGIVGSAVWTRTKEKMAIYGGGDPGGSNSQVSVKTEEAGLGDKTVTIKTGGDAPAVAPPAANQPSRSG